MTSASPTPVAKPAGATMMLAPAQSSQIEMLTLDPRDLAAAVERDTSAVKGVSVPAKLP